MALIYLSKQITVTLRKRS